MNIRHSLAALLLAGCNTYHAGTLLGDNDLQAVELSASNRQGSWSAGMRGSLGVMKLPEGWAERYHRDHQSRVSLGSYVRHSGPWHLYEDIGIQVGIYQGLGTPYEIEPELRFGLEFPINGKIHLDVFGGLNWKAGNGDRHEKADDYEHVPELAGALFSDVHAIFGFSLGWDF